MIVQLLTTGDANHGGCIIIAKACIERTKLPGM